MSRPKLSETPRFRNTCWLTKALKDGSWSSIPPASLGSHAAFLVALKEMDHVAVPAANLLDIDGQDFRIAVGLEALMGEFPKNYTAGRAQAWVCILHFQVLDLLLATDFPKLSEPSVLTPLPTTFKYPASAIKFLKPLKNWDKHLTTFLGELVPTADSGEEAPPSNAEAPESLDPIIVFSKITGTGNKVVALKNLQAMAAGLLWILELGSPAAPLLNAAGRLAIEPLSHLKARYNTGLPDAIKELRLSPAKLLGALSAALTITPVLLICPIDLTTTHIDFEIKEELSHRVLAAGRKSPALVYVEGCLHSLARSSGGCWSAEINATKHLPKLLLKQPAFQSRDTAIFKRIMDGYESQQALAKSVPANPVPPAAPASVTTVWYPRAESIPAPAGGRIFTALSKMPSADTSSEPQMTLLSDLPPSEQVLVPPVPTMVPTISTTDPSPPEVTMGSTVVGSATPHDSPAQTSGSEANNMKDDLPLQTPGEEAITTATTTPPSTEKGITIDPVNPIVEGPSIPDDAPSQPLEDEVTKPDPRRSTRTKVVAPAPVPAPALVAPLKATKTKRKAKSDPDSKVVKRPKASSEVVIDDTEMVDDTEQRMLGLDSEWISTIDPNSWINDLKHIGPVHRSTAPERVSALLPDGSSKRVFDYLGHVGSQAIEYKLIFDVNTSMAAARDRGSKEFQLAEWQQMTDEDRVKLWGTGMDLYIYGLKPSEKVIDLRKEIAKNHRLDAPVEVQVQGLRVPPQDRSDDDANVDYTAAIRTTTLRTLLDEAEKLDHLILNALKLPSGQIVHINPLIGSGFDLELVAYRRTNGLPGFAHKDPPYKEMTFEMLGLSHSLSLLHYDIGPAWIYVWGPGEKFWGRGLPRGEALDASIRNIYHSCAFDGWQPDVASVESCDYDIVALPAGTGIYLQQPGREHTVISTDTGSPDDNSGLNRTASATLGGYFFCASRLRPTICLTLHMVMLQHVLANSDHVALWQIFIRIARFWVNITAGKFSASHLIQVLMFFLTECPAEEQAALAAYRPDLTTTHARGWMDIVYLSCLIVLLPALDQRNYISDGTPKDEMDEAAAFCESYQSWRRWVASRYRCMQQNRELHWEREVFSPCLLHLAEVIWQYHSRTVADCPESEVFKSFTPNEFKEGIQAALHSYNNRLASRFAASCKEVNSKTNFFLFDGAELCLVPIIP
ncbi:hypothetical protein C8R46DRAFT_1313063 [Mycena filopes]|nr:hypothetical protein C8R46DRAFT_1313063 [Mycena filopes]